MTNLFAIILFALLVGPLVLPHYTLIILVPVALVALLSSGDISQTKDTRLLWYQHWQQAIDRKMTDQWTAEFGEFSEVCDIEEIWDPVRLSHPAILSHWKAFIYDHHNAHVDAQTGKLSILEMSPFEVGQSLQAQRGLRVAPRCAERRRREGHGSGRAWATNTQQVQRRS